MKRLIVGALTALASAGFLTTIGVSGQGRVDSSGVMTPDGGVPALGSYKVPKTPWGEPNLQGTYNANDLQGIPMQRAADGRHALPAERRGVQAARRAARPERGQRQQLRLLARARRGVRGEVRHRRRRRLAAAALARAREGRQPRVLVRHRPAGRTDSGVDACGRRPRQQQRQQAQAARRRQLNGVEADWTTDRSNYDRCISTGVLNSITPKIYNSGSRIVQGPGWLAFSNEMIHETRVIPTDGRKQRGRGNQERGWATSVGHWEGDVLVVETRNIKPESVVNGQPLSDEGVLIERFTLADANTLDYRMTINDPKVYAAPWTLRLPIPREESYGFYEYACHEGNYAMRNLLRGSRAEDKRRAEALARGEKIPEYVEPARGGGPGRGGAAAGGGRGRGGN